MLHTCGVVKGWGAQGEWEGMHTAIHPYERAPSTHPTHAHTHSRAQPGDYGRLRTWASVSWTAFAPLAGWINARYGIRCVRGWRGCMGGGKRVSVAWTPAYPACFTPSQHHTRTPPACTTPTGRVGIACYVVGSLLALPAAWALPVEALRHGVRRRRFLGGGGGQFFREVEAWCLFRGLYRAHYIYRICKVLHI